MSLKSSISNNLAKLSGSEPRSSEGIYKTASDKASSLFSPNKSSASRLLSVPSEVSNFSSEVFGKSASAVSASANAVGVGSSANAVGSNASNSNAVGSNAVGASGGSFWRYLIVFLILFFLTITLILFLLKPTTAGLSHLYDPLIDFFNTHFGWGSKNTASASASAKAPTQEKKNDSALVKIEKALEIKPAMNNIDNKQIQPVIQATNLAAPKKNYKKLPVIPQADDSTSAIQMNPTSKAGFCYIGEDRGFRSCIDVGAGDVCMSGDIFPTEAICINPKLRQ
jgi:hypothetical protein